MVKKNKKSVTLNHLLGLFCVVLAQVVVACSGAACAGALSGCTADTFAPSGDGGADVRGDGGDSLHPDAGDAATLDAGSGDADWDVAAPDGAGDAAVETASPEAEAGSSDKRIFISSTRVASNFGGLAAADVACQSAASGAGLGGTWKAWLSTQNISAASRLIHGTADYRLVDGTLIAHGWIGLTSGFLQATVHLDETGALVLHNGSTGTGVAWTGTNADGSATTNTCGDWTVSEDCSQSTAYKATAGYADFNNQAWSSGGLPACCTVQSFAFYCVEQ